MKMSVTGDGQNAMHERIMYIAEVKKKEYMYLVDIMTREKWMGERRGGAGQQKSSFLNIFPACMKFTSVMYMLVQCTYSIRV